jgi:endoglucanase
VEALVAVVPSRRFRRGHAGGAMTATMPQARLADALLLTVVAAVGACRETPARVDRPRPAAMTTAVKLDNFGYRPGDPKVAIFSADPGGSVDVRSAEGALVFAVPRDGGCIRSMGLDTPSGDRVWWVDFSPLHDPGRYHLFSAALEARSYEFEIAPDVYDEVMRVALKTFYRQRCGTPKTSSHAGPWADEVACHRADVLTAPAAGQKDFGARDLAGGWHDAGDYNKYVWRAAGTAALSLLRAFEEDPSAFADGDLDVPESGNGVPDVLDEVRWELDFFLKMQLPDGSVLSTVHADGSANGAAPPSADKARRYYHDPGLESGAVFAGSCARAARVFMATGDAGYGTRLRDAALLTWAWLERQGDSPEKVWAAAEVFRMDPTVTSARRYVDAYRPDHWSGVTLSGTGYDSQAALTYLQTRDATPAVASSMRQACGRQVDQIFATDDLYRSGLPLPSYHWGSNGIRAGLGVFLLEAAVAGATGSRTGEQCRRHALDILHFFHGQNPLGMVYLTNMTDRGGEHSSFQIFHNWFGQPQDAYSRRRFVGKPASVLEPYYPYLDQADNHGIRDDKTSAFGPAPGFVPGGPNKDYSGDAVPPGGSFPNRAYRDWNDQAAGKARTWEITESSIAYQGPYVALAAAFTSGHPERGRPSTQRTQDTRIEDRRTLCDEGGMCD